MARKSRKNLPQPEQAAASVLLPELEEAKIPAAIYGRLSVEDEEKEESMETQIALVQDYINRSSELSYVDTYFDNGFTGTNFKRPAFTRLMNDVRQKKIKCIVVKDLSRFGRNYLEAGYYIETVFPFLGIRLIAVTDNFDSTRKEDMESLALPIRNMVNAMYAKDISKKIWTSLQRKKEAGYAVGNDAPYADYVAGVVDSEDYQLIREDYSRQYDGLRAALQEAENKKVQVEQQIEEYLNMTSHLEEHLDNFEFDIQLVKSLVQKIEVSADKRIRIVFGFRDVFTELGKESAET